MSHNGYGCLERKIRKRRKIRKIREIRKIRKIRVMWIIHSTCLGIHLEEACGPMTTER